MKQYIITDLHEGLVNITEDQLLKIGRDSAPSTLPNINFLNILDYGADPNGVLDSSQAIRDCFSQAKLGNIKSVYAPKGTYLMRSTAYIPSGINFFGDGAEYTVFKIDEYSVFDTIKMFEEISNYENIYKPFFSTNMGRNEVISRDIRISDLSFQDSEYKENSGDFIFTSILVLNTINSEINNVKVGIIDTIYDRLTSNKTCVSLALAFSKRINIDKVSFLWSGYESLCIRHICKYINVTNCTFDIDKPFDRTNQTHAAQVARPSSASTQLLSYYGEDESEFVTFSNNLFLLKENVGGAITMHKARNITIENNIFICTRTKASFTSVVRPFESSSNILIKDNIFNVDEVRHFGAKVGGSVISLGTYGSQNSAYNCLVDGNILNIKNSLITEGVNPEAEKYTSFVGNNLENYNDCKIVNNIINVNGFKDSKLSAIGVRGARNIVSNNTVNLIGLVDGQTNNSIGISVGDSTDSIISNNITKGTSVDIRGNLLSVITNLRLDNNLVQNGISFSDTQWSSIEQVLTTNYKEWKFKLTLTSDITTSTLSAKGLSQNGRNVILDLGIEDRAITVNSNTLTTYTKLGSGKLTFVEGVGRTLTVVGNSGNKVVSGASGSTAMIVSDGVNDFLYITNY